MSRVTQFWHIYLFFSVCIGAGQAFGSFIAANSIITNWFTKRRALAISLLSASGGVGALIFPTLLSWFISSQGWRLAWVLLGGMHLVIAVIAGGLLVRNRPEDMGQFPEGYSADGRPEEETGLLPGRVYQTAVEWTVADALKTPAFWLTVAFSSATMFSMNFLTLHQVAYIEDMGYSPLIAATTAGMLGGMSIIGQLASGALGARIESRYIATFALLGLGIGVSILMNIRALPMIYLHTVISGISAGAVMVVLPIQLGAYFGRTNYARILGWTTPVTTIFSASSPLLAAYIFDATGSYTTVFMSALGLLALGLVCAFLSRPPRPKTALATDS